MKNFKIKKSGQSLVEFVLVGLLVGVVSFWGFYKLNPNFFRSWFKGSVASNQNISSQGQLKMCAYAETNCDPPAAPVPPAPPAPPPTCSPMAIGGVEAGGSIYAGQLGPGNIDVCVTSSDDSVAITWNSGANIPTNTGVSSWNDGRVNTITLAPLIDGGSPYQAAILCDNLVRHGKSDWYLPSHNEMGGVYVNRLMIGGFTNNHYWTSLENNASKAYVIDFNSGTPQTKDKRTSHYVRCMRHD